MQKRTTAQQRKKTDAEAKENETERRNAHSEELMTELSVAKRKVIAYKYNTYNMKNPCSLRRRTPALNDALVNGLVQEC